MEKNHKDNVRCACGCGLLRPKYDLQGRERLYINGHQGRLGRLGKKDSIETRLKKSKIAKEKGFGKWMIGRKQSKESILKMLKSRKGYNHSKETKIKIGLANKGKKRSEEQRKFLSLLRKGKSLTKEHKSKISIANKGRKHTQSTKDKISLSNKGKIRTLEFKKNMSKVMSGRTGEKSNNWKGGVTPINRRLRKSSMFRIWRELVFLRDNFTCKNPNCEFCHNKIGVMLHPHHIKSFSEYPKLRFNVGNGITYCKEFHINSKELHKNIPQIKIVSQVKW